MSLFDRLKDAGRAAASAAMKQPAVKRRVERVQARARELREEIEERLGDVESDLWAWIQKLEAEARRTHRQVQRKQSSAEHYRTLGLQPGASIDEVKAAYRKKMRENHPDRFAHDKQAEAAAHARAQQINIAYGELTALITGREARRG
jgi:DnaJ-domain-containing protein 1